jgi:serine-type D-Ala-D-Ala endopeptidase (penicillin-binding protein 7)
MNLQKITVALLIYLLAISAIAKEHITATSWVVASTEGEIINSQNPDEIRSIASITKLMTAMVILDSNSDLNELIEGTTRSDLIKSMLINSDNKAAELLCEGYEGGRSNCIFAMNTKATALGLNHTKYVDPSGLNIMNISTASELVNIVIEASKYPEIMSSSNTFKDKIKKKNRRLTIFNTNPTVKNRNFIISKTGYIRAAGGCIAIMTENKIVILLGSKNTRTRILEMLLLLDGKNK